MLVVKGYLPKTNWVFGVWTSIIIYLTIGFVTGFVSGMMGVGGGGVMVPLMVVLGNIGQHMAQGTSLLAMIPASISGASTHYKLGNVKLDVAWGLIIGSSGRSILWCFRSKPSSGVLFENCLCRCWGMDGYEIYKGGEEAVTRYSEA